MNAPARRTALGTVAWLITAWLGGAACGGNVVVDSVGASGTGGGGGTMTATTGAGANGGGGTTNGTGSGIQFPDGGSAACTQDYHDVASGLETALGCTASAVNIVQCDGSALVHDACGCLQVGNEALPENIGAADELWMTCVSAGCCGGPQASIGCGPCGPTPTVGYCDPMTSQCAPGSP